MVEPARALAEPEPQPPGAVHPHPIRWDADRQLWVCTQGCGFTRLKRLGEVVPSPEEARAEALRAGTGADFADLPGKTASAEQGPPSAEPESPSPTR